MKIRGKKGMLWQDYIIYILIAIAVLILALGIYFVLFGKGGSILSYFSDKFSFRT